MGIREFLNTRSHFVAGAMGAVILTAGWFTYREASREFSRPTFSEAFFTTDDGRTLFTDDKHLLPPFEYEGKTAVRAAVFEEDGKRVVKYLERFTAETQQAVAAYERDKAAGRPPQQAGLVMGAETSGREVKRPGQDKWFAANSREGRRIIDLTGSDAVRIEP
jgi:hypothetical protein